MNDGIPIRSDEHMSHDLTIFECLDSYESEKLRSMLSYKSDELTYILGIIKTVDNEVVIMLKDRSCHSIIMKDVENTKRLNGFINDLLFKKKSLESISCNGNTLHVNFINNLSKV
jgi:hypothetical protein